MKSCFSPKTPGVLRFAWCSLMAFNLSIATGESAENPGPSGSLLIEADKTLAKVSPLHYGLMTEEINYCYDGGLYAELVRNRAFLDDAQKPAHWSVVPGESSTAT